MFDYGQQVNQTKSTIESPAAAPVINYSAKDISPPPSASGDSRAGVDFTDYLNTLRREIHAYWKEGYKNHGRKVIIEMNIARNGNLSQVKLSKSSGNKKFDQSALRAVESANPVSPPPTELYDSFAKIRLVFDDSRQ